MSRGCLFLLGVVGVSTWCCYQYAAAGSGETDVRIKVSPSTLVIPAGNQCITVSTNIPLSLVDAESLLLNGEVEPYCVKANDCGYAVAKFQAKELKKIVTPPRATICLSGTLVTGEPFEASDTIVVKLRQKNP